MLPTRKVKPKATKFIVYKNLCIFPFNQRAGVKVCSGLAPVSFSI